MPEITVPIEFPAINLESTMPLLILVILAALIVIALIAWSFIQSKALAIVAVAAIIIGGSSSIVGGLQSIALLIGVAGVVTIGLVLALGRQPDVIDLLHAIVPARSVPPAVIDADRPIAAPPTLPQLPSPTIDVQSAARAQRVIHLPRDWGF